MPLFYNLLTQDKLNIFEVDSVKDALRGALEEERQLLTEDIDYLTMLLNHEADLKVGSTKPAKAGSDFKGMHLPVYLWLHHPCMR